MPKTISLILGGGQGSRLFPLTKDRSKPAVPICGKYRLIDIPISNCLNSKINNIFILTQFNSASLNKHINQAYRFDGFHGGFLDILAAEQSMESTDWYQGTADAVRKNLRHISNFFDVKYVLILSGDQVYTMDFRRLIRYHEEQAAEITIPLIPVTAAETAGLGIVACRNGLIGDFLEKPKDPAQLNGFAAGEAIRTRFPRAAADKEYLASMGIYLFNTETLHRVLDNEFTDFGHQVIPEAIRNRRVAGYLYDGYWEDVGTIATFLKANLDFAMDKPNFDFYKNRIFTNARYLPPSRVSGSTFDQAMLSDGGIIGGATVKRSIIGVRSIIGRKTVIEDSIVMGADFYESDRGRRYNREHDQVDIGIGEGCTIRNAIIDKNARIGHGCRIVNEAGLVNGEGPDWYIREGIVIVPKNGSIPDGTVI